MPAALNIKPRKRSDLVGLAQHNFRTGPTPDSADPTLSKNNIILLGNKDVAGAFGAMPERQPKGRKIRSDAVLGASFVMTLPIEIDPNKEKDVWRWVEVSMAWAAQNLPGRAAYATLHLDEPGARAHIHLLKIPEDETGKINYKQYYSSPIKLLKIQDSYTNALRPLSVWPNSKEDKELLAKTYTKDANAASAQLSKQLRKVEEWNREQLDLGRLANDLPIGEPPLMPAPPKKEPRRVKATLPKKERFESSEDYRKRALSAVQKQIDWAQDLAVEPWLLWLDELKERWSKILDRWKILSTWRLRLKPADNVDESLDLLENKQIQANDAPLAEDVSEHAERSTTQNPM